MAKLNQTQIYKACDKAAEDIPLLLESLGIEYIEYPNRYAFACPIHGGDNPEGCCIFTDGTNIKGNWKCWTSGCEEEYTNSLVGFVRGVLSVNKNRNISLDQAIQWTLDLSGGQIDEDAIASSFNPLDIFNKKPEKIENGITREMIISKLQVPSNYFIDRGFSPEILKTFDVGVCIEKNKQMSGRSIAPVYDKDWNYIGCAGRAHNNQIQPKWLYSKGFKKCVLYGIHIAHNTIRSSNTVILVEGQGDVWRMHEAGYTQTVGCFGCGINDDQLILLESSGAMNVIILTDMDEAGEKAYKQIIKRGGRRFNYFRPKISTKDVGDLTTEELKKELQSQIKI